jgi:RNA polymerase sigma-32 factor
MATRASKPPASAKPEAPAEEPEVLEPETLEEDELEEEEEEEGPYDDDDRVVDVGSSPSLPALRQPEALGRVEPLQRFLQQVGRYPLLTLEEEQELTKAVYEKGDPIAAKKLVVHNLRLVVKMAYRYRRAWANVLDLIQEGNIGLIEAVKRFDPWKGARFSTYAAYWIRAYMIRYLLEHSRMVRISRTRAGRKLFFRLSKERERLRALGVEAGPKLLAERLGVSQSDFEEVVKHMDQPEIRLDAPISHHDGESSETVLDTLSSKTVSPEQMAERMEFSEDVSRALESFAKTLDDPREKAAWEEHLMAEDPLPLSALGERFGVTKQRMGQIVMGIRKRLKTHLEKVLGPDVQLDYSMDLE